jgi:hypothetical protein
MEKRQRVKEKGRRDRETKRSIEIDKRHKRETE